MLSVSNACALWYFLSHTLLHYLQTGKDNNVKLWPNWGAGMTYDINILYLYSLLHQNDVTLANVPIYTCNVMGGKKSSNLNYYVDFFSSIFLWVEIKLGLWNIGCSSPLVVNDCGVSLRSRWATQQWVTSHINPVKRTPCV